MVTHDEAAALASALPNVTEGTTYGNRAWKVGEKVFAWDRPFSKADLARFGDDPVPSGPILGIRMDDLRETFVRHRQPHHHETGRSPLGVRVGGPARAIPYRALAAHPSCVRSRPRGRTHANSAQPRPIIIAPNTANQSVNAPDSAST